MPTQRPSMPLHMRESEREREGAEACTHASTRLPPPCLDRPRSPAIPLSLDRLPSLYPSIATRLCFYVLISSVLILLYVSSHYYISSVLILVHGAPAWLRTCRPPLISPTAYALLPAYPYPRMHVRVCMCAYGSGRMGMGMTLLDEYMTLVCACAL